jgi:hypothetical protein
VALECELARQRSGIARAGDRLNMERFSDEADLLGEALERDLITAEDFAR